MWPQAECRKSAIRLYIHYIHVYKVKCNEWAVRRSMNEDCRGGFVRISEQTSWTAQSNFVWMSPWQVVDRIEKDASFVQQCEFAAQWSAANAFPCRFFFWRLHGLLQRRVLCQLHKRTNRTCDVNASLCFETNLPGWNKNGIISTIILLFELLHVTKRTKQTIHLGGY